MITLQRISPAVLGFNRDDVKYGSSMWEYLESIVPIPSGDSKPLIN